MKTLKHILCFFLLLLYAQFSYSQSLSPDTFFQTSGEVYFQLTLDHPGQIHKLTRIVSIDKVNGLTVWAYANKAEFDKFLQLNLPYAILPKPGEMGKQPIMRDNVDVRNIDSWDFYPTYDAYLDMMNQFATNYPDLCETFSIGQSVNGRELMMVKISDNVSIREAEPQFLYTGTMHGDELAGYVLLLRMADYLLSNYASNAEVAALVDGIEIWINPLANPDGTYKGGNHTVFGSTRSNANNVDLNRNYPDPEDGQHPDGNAWQPETLMFMQLAEENNFVMSANTHGGAEVVNYPWDTWSRLAADDSWWQFVSREYADTAHVYAPSSYLDGFVNGITNGYAWYSISGGRQDFMNYFHNCRELTLELSNTKKLPESRLENHWNWNYRSLLNYMKQCTYGVSGIVTDEICGASIAAKISIEGHDLDNSFVYADSLHGFYQRLLDTGTYNLTFSAEGYQPKTISNVSVSRYQKTSLDVQLSSGELLADFSVSSNKISIGSLVDFTDQSFGSPVSWLWEFQGGSPSSSNLQNPGGIIYNTEGVFDVSLKVFNAAGDSSTVSKTGYIHVLQAYTMSNETKAVLNGLFFDSGGESKNYRNNENFLMTFQPALSGAKLRFDFTEFSVEAQASCAYDYLKIYDGNSSTAALLGIWCGTDSPGIISASNSDGALTFEFHSDGNVNLSGWKASFDCIYEQSLVLPEGWSGISSFVEPDDVNIETMFSAISDELIILLGDEGMYYPEESVNTLVNWNSKSAYLIKTNASTNLMVSGAAMQNNTIHLSVGWNYLPVLSPCVLDVQILDAQFMDPELVVKQIAGTGTYWPAMGVYSLLGLWPGKAYLIFVSQPVELVFPVCD